jgi:D-cysteine desulfhydrase
MLMPQPNARYVRRNLLMGYKCGAELHHGRSIPILACATVYEQLRHRLTRGSFPMLIPAGGSSALGATGFVNAALELRDQITGGQMPEPDVVYVALGTSGTASGLMLGLKAAALQSRVVCVAVAPERFANASRTAGLHNKIARYLHSLDPAFPEHNVGPEEVDIRHGFYGEGYAHFTDAGMEAVKLVKETEGIKLEGTYTGKAFACLIDDARKGQLKGKTVLFWNTYNSREFPDAVDSIDYHRLPRPFHRYFEEDVQPLDRGQ